MAGVSQRLVAPKNWIGSESVNLFQVVSDLLDLVQEMNVQLTEHTHGPTPPPKNGPLFSLLAAKSADLGDYLKGITQDH